MRPIRSLCFYLVVVFLGGALLAPALYFLVQNAALHFDFAEKWARSPFHRFVSRSMLILAVAGLWPLMKSLGIKSWRDIGLGFSHQAFRHFFTGFGIGFITLALALLICVWADARYLKLDHTKAQIFRHLLNATLAAIAVGLLEEIVFRGAIFGGLWRALSWKSAIVVSSCLYALVHFFNRPAPPESINWLTGFAILGQMLSGIADPHHLFPSLLNLILTGAILALAYQITGSLYLSIGLHAGWIFWLKSFSFFSRTKSTSSFWGTSKLIDGWSTGLVLLVLFAVFVVWHYRKNSVSACEAV